jgi:stage V sporulation protein D (sporulation-specific penicillin-binding protein)
MIWRYRLALFILLFGFIAVVLRLFYWQIVRASDLSTLGLAQHERLLEESPLRGEIKTSDHFPIATNKVSYLVYANPKQIEDIKKSSLLLSSVLKIDEASISSQLSQDKFWVPLKAGVGIKEKEEISKLNVKGVDFEESYTRLYPEASLSAHLMGFVGKDEFGKDKGYFGLEGYYDRLLRGKPSSTIAIFDALGRPIPQKSDIGDEKGKGSSLVLNIDRTIQFIAEQKLKDAVERYGASGGMVGVIEPKTGKVLAMASLPTFAPSSYIGYSENVYKNPFISNLYEPGSTFKPLIMASALDLKIVTPQTKCNICDKPVSIGGFELKTWNNKYFKDINMTEVIQRSDNTGMIFVGRKLGVDRMLDTLDRFGIGKSTGIDLQGEVYQSVPEKEEWRPVDIATRSFGQGISMTPIELLSGFSSIANKGIRMEPHVVSRVEGADGKILKIEPKVLGRTVSQESSKIMTEMLVNAVNKGEASYARLKGYRIAGKTGTASIPIKGIYDPTKTVASFIGFVPADDPKFAMLVIIDKPTTSIYGSETAAPTFFKIAKDILLYLGVSPSGE